MRQRVDFYVRHLLTPARALPDPDRVTPSHLNYTPASGHIVGRIGRLHRSR